MRLFVAILLFAFLTFIICVVSNMIGITKANEETKDTISWYYFNKVLKDNELKTNEDFAHFMSIIAEHGKNKSYTEIKKIWKLYKDSLKDTVKSIRRRK